MPWNHCNATLHWGNPFFGVCTATSKKPLSWEMKTFKCQVEFGEPDKWWTLPGQIFFQASERMFSKGSRSERPGLPSYEDRDSFIVARCGSQTGRGYRRQNITQRKHTRTHKNTIRGDNKRGEGDRVGLVGASIEMLSVPDWASKLTVIWTGKRAEEQGKRDKWERKQV